MRMNHRQCCAVILGSSFFLFIIVSMPGVVPVQATISSVSVFPSSLATNVGEAFNIDVAVSNAMDLYGWEYRLGWNATLLDAVKVLEGPFLKGAGRPTFFTYNLNSSEGWMIVDCTLLGEIPGVNGGGVLSTVTFYAKNAGECPLDLFNISLINSNDQTILSQDADGYWRSTPPHDIAVVSLDVSPTTAIPGTILDINVTFQNQGSYPEVFNVTVYANSAFIGIQQVSLNVASSTMVQFIWNTTGFEKGDYSVNAFVDPVPGEVDIADNSKAADSLITILALGHDIAVRNIVPFKTVVGQGFSLNVTVTVKNYGQFVEAFNVTLYFDANIIGMQGVVLSSGEAGQLLFPKNSSVLAKGNYTLCVTAGPVSGETCTADNTLTEGWGMITTPGDVDGERSVNIYDAIIIAWAYNSVPGSFNWNPNADINSDDAVDVYDAIILASNFGKTFS